MGVRRSDSDSAVVSRARVPGLPVRRASSQSSMYGSSEDSEAEQPYPETPKQSIPALFPAAGCAWRLVWCYERCHKREEDVRRLAIHQACREAGAVLICLKKAGKFAAWLSYARRPPFVLLTDWREAKPCTQAVRDHGHLNQPALTVVLCEHQTHYERASNWARSLPQRDHVHAIRELGEPRKFLGWVADEVRGDSSRSATATTSQASPPTSPKKNGSPTVVGQKPTLTLGSRSSSKNSSPRSAERSTEAGSSRPATPSTPNPPSVSPPAWEAGHWEAAPQGPPLLSSFLPPAPPQSNAATQPLPAAMHYPCHAAPDFQVAQSNPPLSALLPPPQPQSAVAAATCVHHHYAAAAAAAAQQHLMPEFHQAIPQPCKEYGFDMNRGAEPWSNRMLAPPLAQVLLSVCASHGVQLEKLLKAAMPDHYDE